MRKAFVDWLIALSLGTCSISCAQRPPAPTQLPGDVFLIKNTWYIGGAGAWDYLTMDVPAHRLYIAHSHAVQVVDVETGAVAGQVTGLREAHDIALDSGGQFGYVSDGIENQVKVFDRQTFQVVASIPTGPGPRALALDPQTGLLFVMCTTPLAVPPAARVRPQVHETRTSKINIRTSISVIDVATRRWIGEILFHGQLGFAQADGNGMLYAIISDQDQFGKDIDRIARIDTGAIASLLHMQPGVAASTAPEESSAGNSAATPAPAPTTLDWINESQLPESARGVYERYRLGSACPSPLSLATDGAHQRVFIACEDLRLVVLNGGNGQVVTSLPIGPGTAAVGFDAGRGLIYAAAGDAQGELTIIRQDATDTYNVIQNLPTRERARTLAVNTQNGEVYLVTDIAGVNLTQQGGIGTLKSQPVAGSFGVLVIGH